MSLFEKHKKILDRAVDANNKREFFAQYPEHPKAYEEGKNKAGEEYFNNLMKEEFRELLQDGESAFHGEESSPFWQMDLGTTYPVFKPDQLIEKAGSVTRRWRKTTVEERTGVLIESLERIKERFFEIAYATMHTTGQSFMMAFQASGPHANDRALEALALAYEELTRYPEKVLWDKPMGKFNVKLNKEFKPVPRGISLAIGCSTFPIWNSVPGIYASLMTGNPVIVKPHPKVVMPTAIVVAEIQKTLKDHGMDPGVIQLAVDSSDNPIAKELAESPSVKIIDYTGGPSFGDYVESLPGKITFTEKAGVNSVILDSTDDMEKMLQNLAFSLSLYSGQMCTAPQNFYIPENGMKVGSQQVSYDEFADMLKKNIQGLVNHPKMGPGTLGAIQNEETYSRVTNVKGIQGKTVLEPENVENSEFENARVSSPAVLEVDASAKETYEKELFGPIAVIVKTKNTEESVKLAKEMAAEKGAITCSAYCLDNDTKEMIKENMEEACTPVTFNLTGPIWVNQHAAFSDFHVTGGNPAGNATLSDPSFIVKRFVWVGHREMVKE